MKRSRTPAENRKLTLTLATAVGIALFLLSVGWGASSKWSALQAQLDGMEKHLEWLDKRITK